MPRAAVRSIAGMTGRNPLPADHVIDFHVDNDSVHLGDAITGTVRLNGYENRKEIPQVHLVFHAMEYTVVALPQEEYNEMGMDYLKKHTSEKNDLLRSELTLEDCSKKAQPFRFAIPDNLPSSMRCVLGGTDPTLPSQCQVKYTVTASIESGSAGRTLVSYPISVLPKKEVPESTPLDPSITVSVENSLDVIFKTMFSCGSLCLAPEEYDDPIIKETYILLDTAVDIDLKLCAGQSLQVDIRDWWGQLKGRGVWMVKLTEDLQWSAQGRIAHDKQTWDLFANHHEIPSRVRKSFQPKFHSLLSIRHELVVYLASKDGSKDILATTEPIPVHILSTNRGWDA